MEKKILLSHIIDAVDNNDISIKELNKCLNKLKKKQKFNSLYDYIFKQLNITNHETIKFLRRIFFNLKIEEKETNYIGNEGYYFFYDKNKQKFYFNAGLLNSMSFYKIDNDSREDLIKYIIKEIYKLEIKEIYLFVFKSAIED